MKRKHDGEQGEKEEKAEGRQGVSELVSAFTTSIGTRPAQEDRCVAVKDGWSDVVADTAGWPACRFFAVFDGHSGHEAADVASKMLWPQIQSGLVVLLKASQHVPPPEAIERVLLDAFEATEERTLVEARSSGTTVSCALIIGDSLCVANLGDSRTLLCRAERCVWQTQDHKPALPSERARIEVWRPYRCLVSELRLTRVHCPHSAHRRREGMWLPHMRVGKSMCHVSMVSCLSLERLATLPSRK